jgi:hypothetical protein
MSDPKTPWILTDDEFGIEVEDCLKNLMLKMSPADRLKLWVRIEQDYSDPVDEAMSCLAQIGFFLMIRRNLFLQVGD